MKQVLKKFVRIPFIPDPRYTTYPKTGLFLRWKLGWLRANVCCAPWWSVKAALGLGPSVKLGRRVSFITPVRVVGPAGSQIIIGDDSILDSRPDLYTQTSKAILKIGNNTFINGTRFGVQESIIIGNDCILADVRLMDTDFHSVDKNRVYPEAIIKNAPIVIEDNVWVAAGSAVLKGVRIGKDSVVAFGSVVVSNIPPGKIFGGNPAKEIGNINN